MTDERTTFKMNWLVAAGAVAMLGSGYAIGYLSGKINGRQDSAPERVYVKDFDGDSKKDILVVSRDGSHRFFNDLVSRGDYETQSGKLPANYPEFWINGIDDFLETVEGRK